MDDQSSRISLRPAAPVPSVFYTSVPASSLINIQLDYRAIADCITSIKNIRHRITRGRKVSVPPPNIVQTFS